MTDLQHNLNLVKQRIANAEQHYGRTPGSVKLLAVSKTKPIEAIQQLAALGQQAFGENYLQEALEKIQHNPTLEWHFIGPIQSNKTKPIAEHFNWVHSVDRIKIARRLSEQRPANLGDLNILLQVNISKEDSKSGFMPEDIIAAVAEIKTLPGLVIRGLMAIPKAQDDVALQRQAFAQMFQLYRALQHQLPQVDTLSMGMSGDLDAAIAEGSTLVRIGTDLFGARDYNAN